MLSVELAPLVAVAVAVGALLVQMLIPRRSRPVVEGGERSALATSRAEIAVGRVTRHMPSSDTGGAVELLVETADGAEHDLELGVDASADEMLAGIADGAMIPVLHDPRQPGWLWPPLSPDPARAATLAPQFRSGSRPPLGLVLESQRLEGRAVLDEWRMRRGLLTESDRVLLDHGMPVAGYLVEAVDTGVRRGRAALHRCTVVHARHDGETATRTTLAYLDPIDRAHWPVGHPVPLQYELDGPGVLIRTDLTEGAA